MSNALESLLHVIGSALEAKPPTPNSTAQAPARGDTTTTGGTHTDTLPQQTGALESPSTQDVAGPSKLAQPQGQAPGPGGHLIDPRMLSLMMLLHPEQMKQAIPERPMPQVQPQGQSWHPQATPAQQPGLMRA